MNKKNLLKIIIFSLVASFLVFGSVLAYDLDESGNTICFVNDLAPGFNELLRIDPAPRLFAYHPDSGLLAVKQIIHYIARQEKSPPLPVSTIPRVT